MNAPVESVPVIQADRDAAAAHLEGWRWYESVGPRVVNEIRQGKRDDSETVQNFARHRTNQVAELVEALRSLLNEVSGSDAIDSAAAGNAFEAIAKLEGRASHKGEQP